MTTNHNEKMAQSESFRVRHGTVSHCRKRARERLQCCTEISQEDSAPSETPLVWIGSRKNLIGLNPFLLIPLLLNTNVSARRAQTRTHPETPSQNCGPTPQWSESERSRFTCLQVSGG